MKNQGSPEPGLSLSRFWLDRQPAFTSMLSEIAPNVGSHHVHLAMLLEAVRVEESVPVQFGRGRKARHRCAIARSFVVKAYLNFASTKQFRQVLVSDDALRALCGFWGRVPSESAFSRAFAFLAEVGFGDLVQMRLIQVHESQTVQPTRKKRGH